MDRQILSPELEAWIADKRAQHRAAADSGEDDYLEPKDRRNRALVLGPDARVPVKEDDDVLIGTEVLRVICPARLEGWFMALVESPWGGYFDAPYDGAGIIDRAPADPLDLPAMPEPEPEPEVPSWQPDMTQLRFACFTTIDARSDQMFLAGFDFEGVRLSLSLEAQQRFADMYNLRDKRDDLGNFVIPYPLTFSSLDDESTVTITDPAGIERLYLASAFRKAEIVIGGNQVKDYVRDPSRTAEELAAFEDPRPPPTDLPVEPGQR